MHFFASLQKCVVVSGEDLSLTISQCWAVDLEKKITGWQMNELFAVQRGRRRQAIKKLWFGKQYSVRICLSTICKCSHIRACFHVFLLLKKTKTKNVARIFAHFYVSSTVRALCSSSPPLSAFLSSSTVEPIWTRNDYLEPGDWPFLIPSQNIPSPFSYHFHWSLSLFTGSIAASPFLFFFFFAHDLFLRTYMQKALCTQAF